MSGLAAPGRSSGHARRAAPVREKMGTPPVLGQPGRVQYARPPERPSETQKVSNSKSNSLPATLQIFGDDLPVQIVVQAVMGFHHLDPSNRDCARSIVNTLDAVRVGQSARDLADSRVKRRCRFPRALGGSHKFLVQDLTDFVLRRGSIGFGLPGIGALGTNR